MEGQQRAEAAARRAQEDMARILRRIRDEARANRTQGFDIPTLDADPAADDPTTIWRFEDGRLRVRRADGGVDEFVPTLDTRPRVPSFTSTPSVGSGWRMWMNPTNGRLQVRLADDTIVTFYPDAGAGSGGDGGTGTSGGSTTKTLKPADPRPHRHTKTYSASWSSAFCATHGKEGGGQLYYGYYPGSHGERKIMLGLPDATIRADLSGATIRKVEFQMRNTHAYLNGGVDVSFGAHAKSSEPGSYSSVRERVVSRHWPKSGYGEAWRDVPDWFGERLKSGAIAGITINQPSSAIGYYGQMDPSSFRLRVTFTHSH